MSGLCQYLGISRSGSCAWSRRGTSRRDQDSRALLGTIEPIHRDTGRAYGSPRMHQELVGLSYRCGRHRVARLMRLSGFVAQRQRRFRTEPARGEPDAWFENRLLDREPVCEPNEVWGGDYAYLRVPPG